MVLSCVAYGCTCRFKKGSEIGFYRFPKDEKRRQMWIRAICRRDWKPSEGSRICGKHFLSGAPAPLEDTANPDWAPSINLGHNYFEKGGGELESYHKNLEKVTEDSSQGQISTWTSGAFAQGPCNLEAHNSANDDEEENVEIHKQLSVFIESENAHVESMTSHRNNEDKQDKDRLKYFIFSGPTNSNQKCSITHDEALKATETLLHYMENQDNVDHADLIIIQGYRKRILENMKLAK